ncbi:MAG TPA: hypothetical protein PKX15_00995, partial [Bacteroidales bacterium]|nr:hypothetical protein [Bacteroidales bacterium]
MGRWKGNVRNPAPNPIQAPIERAEKLESINRVEQVRRDTDKQKNITISLYDIDETILLHLEQLQLQVEDQGKQVKVPFFYGSPERWVSARRDGYIRDKQGKIILPAVILKRTNSEADSTLQFFHRYLNVPVMKKYSEKNAYTQFSALMGRNVPINDVYNITMPNHMVLTYHFIVWTAYVEQMNKLIETFQFNTKDYWGSKKGFRFRTKIESYGHTVELQANDERIVKSEFDLITHGYILPDSMTKLEDHILTTQKFLTPKKVVIGLETVTSEHDFNRIDPNREKWQSPYYPNLQKDTEIPQPRISTDSNIIDNSLYGGIKVEEVPLFLRIVHVPTQKNSTGQEGNISYDSKYFYVYYKNEWRRAELTDFTPDCSDNIPVTGNPGQVVTTNSQFFYIYSGRKWKRVP